MNITTTTTEKKEAGTKKQEHQRFSRVVYIIFMFVITVITPAFIVIVGVVPNIYKIVNSNESQQVVSSVTEKIISEDGNITYVAGSKEFTSDGLLNIGDNVTLLCNGNGNACTLIDGE